MLAKILSPSGRSQIYLIALALGPLLVFYGIRSDTEIGLWLGLLGALMGASGNGLAVRHVYPDPPQPPTYPGYNPHA